jgi:uncharacterized repeat protein (TIGR01451 family)
MMAEMREHMKPEIPIHQGRRTTNKAGERRHLPWIRETALVSSLLILGAIALAVPALSQADTQGQHLTDTSASLFQGTSTPQATVVPSATVSPTVTATTTSSIAATPTSNGFRITLAEMGYTERVLQSPWGRTQYSFRLPDNWHVEGDTYFDLEFSYFYTDLGRRGEDVITLTAFGEMTIYLDGQLLQTYPLQDPTQEHAHLRVDLPPELFNQRPGASHQIRANLDASLLCDVLLKAEVLIHPESTLSVNRTPIPPTLDLAEYPRPFYRGSFVQDQVRFVMPAQPSESEMRTAATLAAGLGDLTGNRTVITPTTDVDWLQLARTQQVGSEHLLVIGRPDRNQVTGWLSDNLALPVSIRPRTMVLNSQGPTAVMPGDTFSYTITLSNTTSVSAESLILTDKIPYQASLVGCRPECEYAGGNRLSWSLESLLPGKATSFSLTLQLTDTMPTSSQVTMLDNIAILTDADEEPLNISSLNTPVGTSVKAPGTAVASAQADYFFVYNGEPVPEGDGILQEIISPWHPDQVIMLVTGLNEEAIYKASQALNLRTVMPDMEGPVALVREVRPSPLITPTQSIDLTLADLGYSDQTLYGIDRQELVYYFNVPASWQLTDDAYMQWFFNHSESINERGSTLTLLLNDSPLATVVLDQTNAHDGSLQIKLQDSLLKRAIANKLSIQVAMQVDSEACEGLNAQQAWLSIANTSMLHLAHQMRDVTRWNLSHYPLPYNLQEDLGDLLFALPLRPSPVELNAFLRLAATLGNTARGPAFNPAVSLGQVPDDETLKRYHIIVLGRPSRNPLIQQINSWLPQPFLSGRDEVQQQVGDVLLRLPVDLPLGYVQEIPSPWNQERALLVLTGTTDEGVAWATQTLIREPWRLGGDLALLRQKEGELQVQFIDTRGLTTSGIAASVATALPEMTPVATIARTSTPETIAKALDATQPTPSSSTGRMQAGLPTWVLLLVGITAVAVILVFSSVIWRSRRQKGPLGR